jgi:four helix bundle protein
MATIKRFEELEIWQLARKQCCAVSDFMRGGRFQKDLALEDQINRSSGSVMDNIAEGFDRFSKAEFRQALVIARGSNAEVRSQFYRALDRKWISEEEAHVLLEASARLGIKIHNLIQHLQTSIYREKPTGRKPNQVEEPSYRYISGHSYSIPGEFIFVDASVELM